MKKKIMGIIVVIVIVLGLSLVIYNQIIPDEYVPAANEIALHIQLETGEGIGLLVYDYCADSHEYSGGISNADGSLIKHDSDNIVVWNKETNYGKSIEKAKKCKEKNGHSKAELPSQPTLNRKRSS